MVICPLSILGSAGIVYMLLLRRENRLYHRLMFCLSVSDILTGLMLMLGPIPVPKETGAFLARGNEFTCSLQGFLFHMTLTSALYNVSLIVTFVLMIRYKVEERIVASRYEKYMHIISIGIPLVFGIVCWSLGLYNPVPDLGLARCFLAPSPVGCESNDDMECLRGENYKIFIIFFVMVPFVVITSTLFGGLILIWLTVRQDYRNSRRTSQYNVQNTGRAVAKQAILYGVFFFNTYLWIMMDPILEHLLKVPDGTMSRFVFRVLGEIFYFSQGVFNFFIFIRPRYSKISTARRDQTRLWAFRESVFGSKLTDSRYHHVRERRSSPAIPAESSGLKKLKDGNRQSLPVMESHETNSSAFGMTTSLKVERDGLVAGAPLQTPSDGVILEQQDRSHENLPIVYNK